MIPLKTLTRLWTGAHLAIPIGKEKRLPPVGSNGDKQGGQHQLFNLRLALAPLVAPPLVRLVEWRTP